MTPQHITHFDDAQTFDYDLGHLRGRWTLLGETAGSDTVGVRRIELPAGGWSTPAHQHGRGEEIFYVLGGSGVSWQAGRTAAIRAGDCIVYLPRRGAHTLYADEGLDVLAFGPREYDESVAFPRLDMNLLAGRGVASEAGPGGVPIQFAREAAAGAPDLPSQPGDRPATIVNLEDVELERMDRPRVSRGRRRLGRSAGARVSGLQHVEGMPGKDSAPPHCHSLEEEIFVVLSGSGTLVLDDTDETPVGPGHVVVRPAGTGVAHHFRADEELVYLAYGPRHPGDICFYPRSGKIAFRGVGVLGRMERLGYWDGED
jgi:uncharacterized cupin superfamily protein